MENNGVCLIGDIVFKNTKVNIYHDPYGDKNIITCGWRVKNPNSYYMGALYLNPYTNKVTYPDDAVIPTQTEEDREMLPQFIVTGVRTIDEKLITSLTNYMENTYQKRNK